MAYTYDYDADGNITAEYIYTDGATGPSSSTTTNVYTYGDSNWKDKLTAYKGQTITYDQIGNPLTYRDGITMTWQNGRQLATLNQGENTVSYKYDSNSVRTSKTVNGVEYTYAYLNGKLIYETRGNSKFYYSYDANGTLHSVNYTLTDSSTMQTYYYTHNAQGDIIGIYDSTGTLVAKYTYGDWGNIVSVTDANGTAITDANNIANLNPFRYRSYYYESETGFYYLMTRYYDPVTHRFINADGFFQTGGNLLDTNMSAYCANNPIAHTDSTGLWFGLDDVIAGGIGALVGLGGQLASDLINSALSGSWKISSWQTYVGSGIGGAAGGVTSLYAGPVAGSAVGSGSSTLIGQTLENFTGGQKRSAAEIVGNTAIDTTLGVVTGKFTDLKITGITKGRYSMAAVYKSNLTKLNTGSNKTMSFKVLKKGFISEAVSSIDDATISGFKSFFTDEIHGYKLPQNNRYYGPCYWEIP